MSMEKVTSQVTSKDGTTIAYDKRGSGPAVILVDGAMCFRGFGPMDSLADLLAPHFTIYNYDRRGRGSSTNSKPYKVEREVEDLDALLREAGGKAYLFGTSSGGCLALETAIGLGSKVKRLAVYEPPYISDKTFTPAWKEYRQQLNALIQEDRRGDAAALFMQFVGTPADQVDGMRQAPVWPMFEAIAPTLAYDAAVIGEDRLVPVKRAAKVKCPTLVMNGTLTPLLPEADAKLAEAIPHAQHRVLEGQSHDVNLNILATALTPFFLI